MLFTKTLLLAISAAAAMAQPQNIPPQEPSSTTSAQESKTQKQLAARFTAKVLCPGFFPSIHFTGTSKAHFRRRSAMAREELPEVISHNNGTISVVRAGDAQRAPFVPDMVQAVRFMSKVSSSLRVSQTLAAATVSVSALQVTETSSVAVASVVARGEEPKIVPSQTKMSSLNASATATATATTTTPPTTSQISTQSVELTTTYTSDAPTTTVTVPATLVIVPVIPTDSPLLRQGCTNYYYPPEDITMAQRMQDYLPDPYYSCMRISDGLWGVELLNDDVKTWCDDKFWDHSLPWWNEVVIPCTKHLGPGTNWDLEKPYIQAWFKTTCERYGKLGQFVME